MMEIMIMFAPFVAMGGLVFGVGFFAIEANEDDTTSRATPAFILTLCLSFIAATMWIPR